MLTNDIRANQNHSKKLGHPKFSGIWRYNQITKSYPDLVIINKKKKKKRKKKTRTCRIVNLVVPANYRVKIKENEKRDKFLNLNRELKKLLNMKVTVIPIIINTLRTIPKDLVKGLEDLEIRRLMETIQTTAFQRLARILRRVIETWEDLLSPVKNHQPTLAGKTLKEVKS